MWNPPPWPEGERWGFQLTGALRGVPQGSVLAPTLPDIYDICESCEVFNFFLFANDTNLSYAQKNLKTLEKVVNKQLSPNGEVNIGGYIPRLDASRYISNARQQPWGNSCFSYYENNGIKMHFICKETIQCKPFFCF